MLLSTKNIDYIFKKQITSLIFKEHFARYLKSSLMSTKFLLLLFNFTLSISTMAQINSKNEVIKKIEIDSFSNRLALEMGLKIIELAKSRNQHIAIEICRLNQTIFIYVDDSLPVDKHNWLRRKANVAKQFEESSLSVKNDLIEGKMSLINTFGLDEKDYVAKGGSIPIFVKNSGMIATITVSGLYPSEQLHYLPSNWQ